MGGQGSLGYAAALVLSLIACASASAATITEFPISTPGSHEPRFLAPGEEKIWYTDGGSPGGVGYITLDGVTQDQPFAGKRTFDVKFAGNGFLYWTAPDTGVNPGTGTTYRRPPGGGLAGESGFSEHAVGVDANNQPKFGETRPGMSSGFEHWICDHNFAGGGSCSFVDTSPQNTRITSLAAAPDGAMWGTEYEDSRVFRWTGTAPTTFISLGAGAQPYRLGVGPDGNIWVAAYGANALERITPAGVRTTFTLPPLRGPNDIAAGPDGNVWFPEFKAGKIGCITPAGKVSEYDIPTPGAAPWGITAGPDGALWFSESNKSKIGRLVPTTPCGAGEAAVPVTVTAAGDTTAPSFVRKLALSPSKFRVASGSTALTARKKRRARAGSKFAYTLSETGTVTIAIQRPTQGRRVGGKCKTKRKSNRKRAKCTLYKTVGTLTRKAGQGAATNKFSGRIGKRKLKRGPYRAAATARDAAGNVSKSSNASFKIVR